MRFNIKFKLVEEWRVLLFKAWSSRLMVLSFILLLAEQSLPLWNMLPNEAKAILPSWVVSILPVISLGLATWARLIRQPKLERKIDQSKGIIKTGDPNRG